jgi:DNA-binding transcriptional MocR family regulator
VAGVTLATLLGDLAAERPPLYTALAARVRMLVADGRLPVGERLPPERDLATALHVSRATVASAYRLLREQGWATARQGAGTWTRLPAAVGSSGGAGRHGAWLPAPPRPGVIDLAHAAPSAPPQVSAAFGAALEDLPRFLPGHGYHPQGLPELRARIAERYAARGLPTTPDQVLVTSGALEAVALVVEALSRRADRVLVEHPTYPNAVDAVRARGRRPVPVAVDADDPDRAVRDLSRSARSTAPALAYVMPDFQNPTGMLLDEPQRRRLAVGLRQAGTVVLVDETVAELDLRERTAHGTSGGVAGGGGAPGVGEPVLPFAAAADPAPVVTVGSLSKSVWGGLRVGWVRAEPDLLARVAQVAGQAQLSGPVLEQLAACHLLEVADEVLALRTAELRARRDALVAALGEHLPDWRFRLPSGGLVLWCELPGLSSTSLVGAARDRGVQLAAGPLFGTGHAFDDRLRLPFTQPVEALRRGVALLAEAAADLPRRRPGRVEQRLVV